MSDAQSETESAKPAEDSEKTTKPKKPSKADLVQNLLQAIDGKTVGTGKFPRKFLIVRDKAGNALWLERNDSDVVWLSTPNALIETLQKYVEQLPGKKPVYLKHNELKNIADLWACHTKAIKLDDISVAQQKSEKGLTWHRMDFDFAEGPSPTWDEILGRMENNAAFLVWFGSLFDARSDRAQYIWLSGSGDNSKGTIIDMLAHIFGKDRGFKSAEPWDKRPGQFWKRMILGSRIVCFPECNDPKFVTTEGFKSLTGDSFHSLDGKFADIFTAELNCKFLIASNERAEISGEWSERKRLIPCHMEPIVKGNFLPKSLLYPRLIAEIPAFCHKAFAAYRKACPNGDRIVPKEDITDAWVERSEERFQSWVDKYFVLGDGLQLSRLDMHEFRSQPDIRLSHDPTFGKFVKFLERLGVKRMRSNDRTSTIYKGLGKSAYFTRQTLVLEALDKVDKGNGGGNGGAVDLGSGNGAGKSDGKKSGGKKYDDYSSETSGLYDS